MTPNKLIIITGQTATGKTDLAIQLASQQNGELINCDSRQIYKGLDIISGKDLTNNDYHEVRKVSHYSVGYYTFEIQDSRFKIPIWLYDIITPTQAFSSFNFQELATEVITDIWSRGKVVILVGGTYFYLKHLLYNLVTTTIAPNEDLRQQLSNKTVQQLQDELAKINPALLSSLNNSDRQNPHRLIRKIEISTQQKDFQHSNNEYDYKTFLSDVEITYLGLQYKNKDTELESISKRVDKRYRQGAIDEVKKLLSIYKEQDPGMNTIGYQQLIPYVKGETSLEKATQEWITKEIQYAKRQFTFMKKDPHIVWNEI